MPYWPTCSRWEWEKRLRCLQSMVMGSWTCTANWSHSRVTRMADRLVMRRQLGTPLVLVLVVLARSFPTQLPTACAHSYAPLLPPHQMRIHWHSLRARSTVVVIHVTGSRLISANKLAR